MARLKTPATRNKSSGKTPNKSGKSPKKTKSSKYVSADNSINNTVISNNGSKLNPFTQIRWFFEATIDYANLFVKTRTAKLNLILRIFSFYAANQVIETLGYYGFSSDDSVKSLIFNTKCVCNSIYGIIFENVLVPMLDLVEAYDVLDLSLGLNQINEYVPINDLFQNVSSQVAELDYYNMIYGVYFFFIAFGIHTGVVLLFDILKYFPMVFTKEGDMLNFFLDEELTEHYYTRMKWAVQDSHSQGVDLGFNFYNGDYTKDRRQAQLDKFEHAFRLLGLKPGMRVMDVGCGMGDWLIWLKTEKGCTVRGVNLTKAHAQTVIDRGVHCDASSWQDLMNRTYPDVADKFWDECYQNFDAVTFWDTIEHYCKPADLFNYDKRTATYSNMFNMARDLLDPNSECQVAWSSTLHISRRLCRFGHFYDQGPAFGFSSGLFGFLYFNLVVLREWINCYILNCIYNGQYPGVSKNYSLAVNSEPHGFRLVHRENRIEDYRMTSMLCTNHFGNYSSNWGSLGHLATEFYAFLFSPHFFIYELDCLRLDDNAWMWHVGGTAKERHWLCPTHLFWDVYSLRDSKEKDLNPLHKQTLPTYVYCDNTTLPAETALASTTVQKVGPTLLTVGSGKSPRGKSPKVGKKR